MRELFDDNAKELVELGVIDALEVTKKFMENVLNVTLTDCTGHYLWHVNHTTVKAFSVTDPVIKGSAVLTLLINFRSTTCLEPISFCFINTHNSWLIANTGSGLTNLSVIDFERGLSKTFKPFCELTRKIYRTNAYQAAKENT